MKRKSKGFTILEILISIVILTVGILGILAIFPKAIESASKSIEDTYSGIIAQSVRDAIKAGIRETKVTKPGPSSTVISYFLIQHDGVGFTSSAPVKDIKQVDITNETQVAGYRGSILLPTHDKNTANPRIVFYYPKELSTPNFQGTFPSDDASWLSQDPDTIEYPDIYAFGGPNGASKMKDRLDKLLSDKQSGSLTPQGELELLKLKKDPYLSYGFGFAVNKTVLNNGQLSNDLYQFQIKIFRNWVKAKGHKANKPIREIGTLISF